MDELDSSVLQPEVGIRAVWLLYRRGKWGYLEDFGIQRHVAEPLFDLFNGQNPTAGRLTKAQCHRLAESVPGVREAAVELQLAYVLKYYEGARHEALLRKNAGHAA